VNPETFDIPIKNSSEVDGSIKLTVTSAPVAISLTVNVVEPTDQATYEPVVVTRRIRGIIKLNVTINIANTSSMEEEYRKYTISEIVSALENSTLSNYFDINIVNLNGSDTVYTSEQEPVDYTVSGTFDPARTQSPFWELGTGEYNEFFGEYRPYWITFISNTNPTQNKIYNNLEWRDIVTDNTGHTQPFRTFDHLQVWNENQDTESVEFKNQLSIDPSRQPISYNAVISNLRKKFNVWRCQIPRDKKALNTNRARISNPWCYIKLSKEINLETAEFKNDRHEFTDLVVDYFM
jgi:hypothetical protein